MAVRVEQLPLVLDLGPAAGNPLADSVEQLLVDEPVVPVVDVAAGHAVTPTGRGGEYAGVHSGFVAWLAGRRISERTRGNYAERVDKYLRWLADYDPRPTR